MAIDTRDKRASVVHVLIPGRGYLPTADGTIAQADRQQIADLYRGILAGAGDPLIPAYSPDVEYRVIDTPFENWDNGEVQGFTMNFAARMNGAETGSAFAVYLPGGWSALSSAYSQYYGTWNGQSALQSGSANVNFVVSATGISPATKYIFSGKLITNSANVYVEAFRVLSYGAHD